MKKPGTCFKAVALSSAGGFLLLSVSLALQGAEPAGNFSWGMDEQFRPLEHHNRNIWFGPDAAPSLDGPPVDCVRFRERAWFAYKVSPELGLFGRLAHRWWHYYSRPGPNDEKRSTWRFPDETVVDNLRVQLSVRALPGWTLCLGRQDLTEAGKPIFGNGLILNDGSTNDGGRTAYVDGALLTWRSGKQSLRVGAFHLNWKDRFLVINDVQRTLRPGNTEVFAGEWTRPLGPGLLGSAYVYDLLCGDEFAAGQRLNAQTVGLRLFSAPSGRLDAGLELARQFGRYQGGVPGGPMKALSGLMVDLRIGLRAAAGDTLRVYPKFQYNWFSGDRAASAGRHEGWHPLLAANVPLFREECYYTLNKGWWTNLHRLSVSCELVLSAGQPAPGGGASGRMSLSPSWTSLYQDRKDVARGGRHIGEMPGLFFDWQVRPWLKLNMLGAVLLPGNHYQRHGAGEWVRVETTFSY